jgi:benzoate-CoA ligase
MEERVAIICYDSPEFIASFLGTIKIGAVAVPLNTRLHAHGIEYYLNNCRAEVLIVHRELWEEMKHLKNLFVYLKHLIVIEKENHKEAYEDGLSFYQWIDQEKATLDAANTTKDDQALWLYTSGTTGKPKGVIHLQHDIEFCANHFAANILNLTENDITFSASKLFFAYGLGNGLYYPLLAGAATVLLPDRVTPEVVFKTIEKYKPTIFFGVPTLYNSMLRYAESTGEKYDLASLRICMSSAEPLPLTIFEKWQQLYGIKILDAIGSTEALHSFISNRINDIKEGSSGKLVPGYEARITGDNGEDLPDGQIGNLLIKGDSLGAGYFNLHEKTKGKFVGEWFVTGDKYYKDAEGYYYYCGRSDEMMKVCGMWVSPYEIENCLLKNEYILEAAVVGSKDAHGLIKPKGFVVLKDGVKHNFKTKASIMEYIEKLIRSLMFV